MVRLAALRGPQALCVPELAPGHRLRDKGADPQMSNCQRCHARAQLWLCGTCSRELRELLMGLAHGQKLPTGQIGAGWIENLTDAVYGLTRLGESARRSTDRNSPLMVHMDASRLLDNVHAMLVSDGFRTCAMHAAWITQARACSRVISSARFRSAPCAATPPARHEARRSGSPRTSARSPAARTPACATPKSSKSSTRSSA